MSNKKSSGQAQTEKRAYEYETKTWSNNAENTGRKCKKVGWYRAKLILRKYIPKKGKVKNASP